MNDRHKPEDLEMLMHLRRCIMGYLYECFQDHPYAVVELPAVEARCGTDVKTLNWNLVYLEKCGVVELGKFVESPPYIASSVTLTAAGIDLIENPPAFDCRFPVGDPDPGG